MDRREIVALALIAVGILFFATSIFLMYNARALASLLAAALGFSTLSLGIDLYKEVLGGTR